uniref:Uncharacterized protein n=1 Tax=Steinernema glaseri TaxID=37863 RepID=A0A1I7YM51_9BILA
MTNNICCIQTTGQTSRGNEGAGGPETQQMSQDGGPVAGTAGCTITTTPRYDHHRGAVVAAAPVSDNGPPRATGSGLSGKGAKASRRARGSIVAPMMMVGKSTQVSCCPNTSAATVTMSTMTTWVSHLGITWWQSFGRHQEPCADCLLRLRLRSPSRTSSANCCSEGFPVYFGPRQEVRSEWIIMTSRKRNNDVAAEGGTTSFNHWEVTLMQY